MLININNLGSKGEGSTKRPFERAEIKYLMENLGSNVSYGRLGLDMAEATGIEAHSHLSVGDKVRKIKNWMRESVEFAKLNTTEGATIDQVVDLYLKDHAKKGKNY